MASNQTNINDIPNKMLEKAIDAMQHAYAPYSNFQVGACLRSEDHQLYAGCNVENISFPQTLCAESSAIAVLISAGKKHIQEVLIVNSSHSLCSPCGACLQQLSEFASPDTSIHLCSTNGKHESFFLKALLPNPFHTKELKKR